jgi:hypothetical protein
VATKRRTRAVYQDRLQALTHSWPPTVKRSLAMGSPSPMPLTRLYPTIVCSCSPDVCHKLRDQQVFGRHRDSSTAQGGPLTQVLHAQNIDEICSNKDFVIPVMVSVTVLDVERHDLSGLAACPSAGGIAAAAACSGAARMPASAAFQMTSSGTRLTQTLGSMGGSAQQSLERPAVRVGGTCQ